MGNKKGWTKERNNGTGAHTAPLAAECHSGNIPLLTVEGKGTLYIGGMRRGADFSARPLVIDMTEEKLAEPKDAVTANWTGRKALPSFNYERYPWVNIPTRDYGIPKITGNSWRLIATQLKTWLKEGNDAVVVCYGGHGRSGTAAAILLQLIDPQPGDPVERVRLLGCQNMVETDEQIGYVAKITEVAVSAKAPNRYFSAASKWDVVAAGNRTPVVASGKRTFGESWLSASPTSDVLYAMPCLICTTPTENDPPICDDCAVYDSADDAPRFK